MYMTCFSWFSMHIKPCSPSVFILMLQLLYDKIPVEHRFISVGSVLNDTHESFIVCQYYLTFVESITSDQKDPGFFHYGPVTWLVQSYPHSYLYCPDKHNGPAALLRGKPGDYFIDELVSNLTN